ncbi:P pilus assembly protein [Vibrio ishigakensis]|uniref:P pilus assembly protein n=1 Tax=Vibrio ishigakensis TaxID=1481914 RepID=A0A0B8NYD2_9VIBR|nr:P pilus assembly protein [Vibrio ishigakensis]
MKTFWFLLLLLVSWKGLAYQVSPMFQTFEVAGRASQGSYEVSNTDPTEITLQAVVYSVKFDALGKEVLTPNEDDFLILPPQSKIAHKRASDLGFVILVML